MKILVINGPNINMIGVREPDVYGTKSYNELVELCKNTAQQMGVTVSCYQSNHEGNLIDAIQSCYNEFDGIVINPAGYTHTSVALLDALKSVGIPAVEVHISDIEKREEFRQKSYVRQACYKTISGYGIEGYAMAIKSLVEGEYNK